MTKVITGYLAQFVIYQSDFLEIVAGLLKIPHLIMGYACFVSLVPGQSDFATFCICIIIACRIYIIFVLKGSLCKQKVNLLPLFQILPGIQDGRRIILQGGKIPLPVI